MNSNKLKKKNLKKLPELNSICDKVQAPINGMGSTIHQHSYGQWLCCGIVLGICECVWERGDEEIEKYI